MKTEGELDSEIASMFDEVTETHVTRSGKAVSQRTLLDEELRGDEMREACEELVKAHKRFEHWDSDIRKCSCKFVNLEWWKELNKLSAAEERVRELFFGGRTQALQSNMHYAQWRRKYLDGKNIQGGRLVCGGYLFAIFAVLARFRRSWNHKWNQIDRII